MMQRLIATLGLLLWATSVFAQATDQVTYYHTDAIGSVRMITDATGQVLQRHDYLPFGEEWTPTPGSTERRLFAGKEWDAETTFDYFGGRYYANGSGRFTSVDPAYIEGDNLLDPQRWNRYVYARDNPLRYTDPDGRVIFDWAEFKKYVNEVQHFGDSGYGYPTKALLLGERALQNGAGRVVIGKVSDLTADNLQAGERTLLERLPDFGSPKANWQQNASVLRNEMRRACRSATHPLTQRAI